VEPAGGSPAPGGGPLLPPLPARRRPPAAASTRTLWRLAAVLSIGGAWGVYLYGALRPVESGDSTAWGLVLFPVLAAIATVVVTRVARHETRFDLVGIALTGFGARGLAAYLRFSSAADAVVYHAEGSRLAVGFRSFDFFIDTGREIPGTGWIRYVSGLTHAFLVDDMFASFMVFTFLGFVGCVLLYTAFARAVPDGDHRRYALLIFLWPSLVFWPASLGKEAWMVFGLGLAAAGVSHVLRSAFARGLVQLLIGIVVLSLVRPHIALMVLIGLGIALLVRPGKASTARFIGRVLSIGLLLIGGAIVAGRTAELLKVDNTGTEGISTALEDTAARTAQGSGSFAAPIVRTPADYPIAFVSVWFRPYPWEARNGGEGAGPQLLSAGENLALLGLVALSWRRLRTLPRALLQIPYVTFAATYVLVFVYVRGHRQLRHPRPPAHPGHRVPVRHPLRRCSRRARPTSPPATPPAQARPGAPTAGPGGRTRTPTPAPPEPTPRPTWRTEPPRTPPATSATSATTERTTRHRPPDSGSHGHARRHPLPAARRLRARRHHDTATPRHPGRSASGGAPGRRGPRAATGPPGPGSRPHHGRATRPAPATATDGPLRVDARRGTARP
jgi:hypothetical protein